MINSICFISREYPPDSAFGGIARVVHAQATALARTGVSVHVITLAPGGNARTYVEDGVAVHRVAEIRAGLPPDMVYVHAGLWSQAVAAKYAEIDPLARFDVIHAADYFAETLHLVRRPETALVSQLHALSRVVAERSGRATTAGERALGALELAALQQADLLLAPTPLVLDETRALMGAATPAAELVPLPLDLDHFAPVERPAADGRRLRLLYVGRLEELKGPDLALHALAALKGRGIDAELTLLGRDIVEGGRSYRRDVLIPLLSELGLGWGDVRFVEQVDADGVYQHLRHADAAVLPSRFENFHTAAVEALATGLLVVSGAQSGLSGLVSADDGLVAIPVDDPQRFGQLAADALDDAGLRARAAERAPARVRELCEPSTVTERQLEVYRRLAAKPDAAAAAAPGSAELSIVILAHNAVEYTQRCIASVERHTDTPHHVYLVDNASTDATPEWAKTLDPERVTVVSPGANLGVSGGRNAGIRATGGRGDYVVFLDNDVEVFAGWWRPFVAALDEHADAGIAGDKGMRLVFDDDGRREVHVTEPGPADADMVIGYCMFMRASAVRQIGLFDENLGLFWHDDDDYCLRARKLGYPVLHIGAGRLIHFEHKSSREVDGIWEAEEKPSELSQRNQRYLAEKWQLLSKPGSPIEGSRDVAVLAFADEVLEDPELLRSWGERFDDRDGVTLVIYAPDADEATIADRIMAAARAAGLDGAAVADLMLLAVPGDAAREAFLGQAADAVYSKREAAGSLHAPPHFAPVALAELAELVARRTAAIRELAPA
ncbi:MAG: hypothetical protein QOJ12_939 [Thermoleophilales bacterium]|jgi:glycosyltransferase involved in cell wall biosynthesis|nr:hypothetical protein [Thermoleophilales bacterium]